MAPPFILTLLLAAKVEHQEEDTPKLWAALSSEVGRQKTRPNRDSRYGLASWLTPRSHLLTVPGQHAIGAMENKAAAASYGHHY